MNKKQKIEHLVIEDGDLLFFKIYRNLFIRTKIFSYLNNSTPSLSLLPKYYSNIDGIYNNIDQPKWQYKSLYLNNMQRNYGEEGLQQIRVKKYYNLTSVYKLVKYNKELLKYKVSRGELNLRFDVIPGYTIFNLIKDKSCVEFFKNLFTNYSKYFIDTKFSMTQTLNTIIRCDCLVALIVLLEDIEAKFKPTILIHHYLNSIKNGSVEIANYLTDKYKFILNESEKNRLYKEIMVDEKDENSDSYPNIIQNLNLFNIFNKDEQIKEFGYVLEKQGYYICEYFEELRKNKVYNYLSSKIGFPTTDSKLEIQPLFRFSIKEKRLQFIFDCCYSISLMSPLILSPSTDFQYHPISKGIIEEGVFEYRTFLLSIERLNEIKQLFSKEEFETNLEDLDFKDNQLNDVIRQMVKMVMIFGFKRNNDINDAFQFYRVKYLKVNTPNSTYSFQIGNYQSISSQQRYFEFSVTISNKMGLFRFCKNDMLVKTQFLNDLIIDINTNYVGFVGENAGQYLIYIFLMLVSYGNLELLEIFIKSTEKSERCNLLFQDSIDLLFGFIKTTQVFDLFYNKVKSIGNKFDISQMIGRCPYLEGYGDGSGNPYTITLLNHFKTKYPQDFDQQCIDNITISKNIYLNQFIIQNLNSQDKNNIIKEKIQKLNFWTLKVLPNISHQFTSLPLEIFKIILKESTPKGQEYSCLSNIEILAYIVENRKQDLDSGICIPPSNKTLFNYYYFSNQFSTALKTEYDTARFRNQFTSFNDQVYDDNSSEEEDNVNEEKDDGDDDDESTIISQQNLFLKIDLILNRSKVLKYIIKHNEIEDLVILLNFISELETSRFRKKGKKSLDKLKTQLLFQIIKYNSITALEYIVEYDKKSDDYQESTNKFSNSFSELIAKSLLKVYSKRYSLTSIEVINSILIRMPTDLIPELDCFWLI